MGRSLRVGSTFSGVGGADLGLERSGFDLAWTCEWDEWKRSVLAAHWPNVPHYSDVRDLHDPPSVDLLVGGFPCQDLSVAGKRRGFDGERSVLAFEFLRIAESLRPRWLLMENVPGLLSSNGGRDLARLLDEVGAIGYGWAYRILDARYFGVPQRRRRVFICARRADTELDTRAAAGLALRALWEGSGGDPTPGWPPRANVAASTRGSIEGSRIVGVNGDTDASISNAVTKKWSKGTGGPAGDECQNLVTQPVAATLTSGSHPNSNAPGRRNKDDINAVAYRKSKRAASDQDDKTWVADGAANTLNAFDAGDTRTTHAIVNALDRQAGGPDDNSAQAGRLVPHVYPIDDGRPVEKHQNGTGIGDDGAPAYTLDRQQQPAIAQTFSVYPEGGNGADIAAAPVDRSPALTKVKSERGVHITHVAPTLTRHNLDSRSPQSEEQQRIVGAIHDAAMSVRRLTPVECERLMGWPDNWTAPPGIKAPDSKRYAACGDGIVSHVAYWIGCRIQMIEND